MIDPRYSVDPTPETYRAYVNGDISQPRRPMITLSTAPDAEIAYRMALGEDWEDIWHEYTTSFWVQDRTSWYAAWRMARCIKSGVRFDWRQLANQAVSEITVLASRHHARGMQL